MKQAIGTTQIMNYVIIFIAITFCFLIATLGYMKAFKLNSRISGIIEKYEGYNEFAKRDIKKDLNTLGYKKGNAPCDDGGVSYIGYYICVKETSRKENYFRYNITTYIEFGPILGVKFKFPIKSQTEKIYYFSD